MKMIVVSFKIMQVVQVLRFLQDFKLEPKLDRWNYIRKHCISFTCSTYKLSVVIEIERIDPETRIAPLFEPTIIFDYQHVYLDYFGYRFTKRIKSQKSSKYPNPKTSYPTEFFLIKNLNLMNNFLSELNKSERSRIGITVYLIDKSNLYLEIQMRWAPFVVKTSC